MIQVSSLSKAYGTQTLFDGASFILNERERVGLIGRNGSGKSTLFKLILDEEHPDSGTITFPRGYKIGRLSQHLSFTEKTILSEVCLGLPVDERDQTYRGEIILQGLGFTEEDMERAPEEFSGGFQIRINLARLLLSEPNLLLLDEPTNYLDIVSSRWLAGVLRSWKGELIIITHDRAFMDSVTTHSMLLYRGTFKKIQGNSQKLFDTISIEEEVYEKTRLNEDKKRREIEQFVNRFRAKASKATLVQSRVKALEKMTVKQELTDEDTLDFMFANKEFFGKVLLEAQDITFGYVEDLIKKLSFSVQMGDRIGVIGKNGKGKSTLLRVISEELKAREGSITKSPNTVLGFFGQTNIERLTNTITVEQEIAAAHPGLSRTRVRGVCGAMMFEGDAALKKIAVLSGGERSRVLLGKIIATPSNLLLLDEPTNHLDLDSIEALKDALQEYQGGVIMVTHDEMLLRETCTRLIVFQGDKPFLVEGGYDYFLEKHGWEEEQKNIKQKTPSVRKESDGKKIKDLERKIEKLESRIITLEQKEKDNQVELEHATKNRDFKALEKASIKADEIQKEIESNFDELSRLEEQLKGR